MAASNLGAGKFGEIPNFHVRAKARLTGAGLFDQPAQLGRLLRGDGCHGFTPSSSPSMIRAVISSYNCCTCMAYIQNK